MSTQQKATVEAAIKRLLAQRHVDAVNGLTSGYMSRLATIRYFLDLGIAAHDKKEGGRTGGLNPVEWDARIFADYVANAWPRSHQPGDTIIMPGGVDV
jgi:hypothetical protein